jgi:hypothetical protein
LRGQPNNKCKAARFTVLLTIINITFTLKAVTSLKIKKMNRLKNDQAGFSHVELFIVLVVFAVIGFAGYHVYQNGQTKDNSTATVSNSNPDDQLTPPPADPGNSDLDSQAADVPADPDAVEQAQ